MLFHSGVFLLAFLPLVLGAYLAVRPWTAARPYVLIAGSLIFYTYWDWRFTPILVASILTNYLVGLALDRQTRGSGLRWMTAAAGITFNLSLLGWFKYADWLIGELMPGGGESGPTGFTAIAAIGLPLGISFYTFQQISYLVDRYRGSGEASAPASYAAYVSFFPQLVAGPIVLHRTFAPQLRETLDGGTYLLRFLLGLLVFAIGFVKKIYLADNLAVFVNQAFEIAGHQALTLWEAWLGVFGYGLQLYFDFSGYSDMAIGLGLLFGFRLPVNFASPYRATSIVDFWRRWHITLSAFLREYLYIPLGGSHRGPGRTTLNLMIVMLLGGLWHGAGWTFVVWGSYHGVLLVLNHWWRKLAPGLRPNRVLAQVSTLVLVMIGWVFFRAADLGTAISILASMMDFSLASLVEFWQQAFAAANKMKLSVLSPFLSGAPIEQRALAFTVLGLAISLFLPNSNRWSRLETAPGRLRGLASQRAVVIALCASLPAAVALFQMWRTLEAYAMNPAEFIYFIF